MLLVFPFAALHSHLANFNSNLSNTLHSITTKFSHPNQNLKVVSELKQDILVSGNEILDLAKTEVWVTSVETIYRENNNYVCI